MQLVLQPLPGTRSNSHRFLPGAAGRGAGGSVRGGLAQQGAAVLPGCLRSCATRVPDIPKLNRSSGTGILFPSPPFPTPPMHSAEMRLAPCKLISTILLLALLGSNHNFQRNFKY